MRTVIIGNSGSGKTWLARRLGETSGAPIVHLDDIFWQPGGFNAKRSPAEVSLLVEDRRALQHWIVEGVYGNLARPFAQVARTLVWLDLPWEVCRQRLETRGSESSAHMDRQQSGEALRALLQWAQDYDSRQGSSGQAAHRALFESFDGERVRLRSQTDVADYLGTG